MVTLAISDVITAPFPMVSPNEASTEAILRSNLIWARGFKQLGDIISATDQGHVDQTAAAWLAMRGAASVEEAATLQSAYTSALAAHTLDGATRLIEATGKLARTAMLPLTDHMARLAVLADLADGLPNLYDSRDRTER